MSGIIRQFIAEAWQWGRMRPEPDNKEIARVLNNQLGKLAETLQRIHQAAENGPVPGAYLPIPLYCDTPDIQNGIAFSYFARSYQGFRIIGMGCSLSGQSDSGSDVEFDIKYQIPSGSWTTIFTTTPQTVTASVPIQLNSAGDFVSDYFAATDFRLDCTGMTNIPKGLMVLLYIKNVGKIEPVP